MPIPGILGRTRHILAGAAFIVAAQSITACPAAAQNRAQRDSLDALRDSLAGCSDSISLLALEQHLIALVRVPKLHDPANTADSARAAIVHLRIGFVDLRVGDVAGRSHYDGAASEFQWTSELEPKWPYGWFGLGLAELGVGDFSNPLMHGLQTMLGKDALTRSAIDFARSADVDPAFVQGLVELSSIALRQRVNVRLDVALDALRRAARTSAGKNSDVLLARARVERAVGSPDSSVAAITTLLAREPDNSQGLLELARSKFLLRQVDGGDAWYRGLGKADKTALAYYRSDLTPVLPDSTLTAFDAGPADARVALMRRFWNLRDAEDVHRPGERLMEHYRRLDQAQRLYRLTTTSRHYDIVERYRPTLAEFDDRGVVYVRLGPPDDKATLSLVGLLPNESWVYHRGDHDLLFHFVAREQSTDYRLVESLFDIIGNARAIQLAGDGEIQGTQMIGGGVARTPVRLTASLGDSLNSTRAMVATSLLAEQLLRSREKLSGIYSRMLTSGKGSAVAFENEEREGGRESIVIGTTTDSWPLTFPAALPAHIDVVATGADSSGPEMQIAFAIPGSALMPLQSPRGAVYPITLRASALSLDGQVIATLDTSRIFVTPNSIGPHDFLLGRQPVRLPPGTFTVRVALEAGTAGIITARDTVRVASPLGPSLGLSDLALGTPGVHLVWRTMRGDTVALDPLYAFRGSDPMELYFEVTGLPPGSTYHVELAVIHPGGASFISKLFGGGGTEFKARFDQTTAGGTDPVHHEVSLEKLKPGRYVLQVSVSTATERPEVRRREFTVVK